MMPENSKNKKLEPLLEIKNLRVKFPIHKKWIPAVDGVNLSIRPGEITGVVGESGSGKSVMSQSILRLKEHDSLVQYEGEILFEKEDILKRPLDHMRDIRGEAQKRIVEMLKLTGIPTPEKCIKKYPFELSGGMQQRVMIAMALACEPKLLIADEPTTALDVSIQEQIIRLIRELNERLKMSVLFITHDMGVVSQLCHSVKVMYLGQVVEDAETEKLFSNPSHPYTQGLLSCIPHLGVERGRDLPTISGSVPSLSKIPEGCHFCTRCTDADERCFKMQPPLLEVEPNHMVRCWKYTE